MIEYTEYKLEKGELSFWKAVQEYITENSIDGDIVLTYTFGNDSVFNKEYIRVNSKRKCVVDRSLTEVAGVLRIYGYTYLNEVAIIHCNLKGEIENAEKE